MRIKAEWLPLLHRLRAREMQMIFGACPVGVFPTALELGAGDGFQSRILSRYARDLVSTDYDPKVLSNPPTPSVTYMVCDAEEIDRQFADGRFDLIYSSNLLEHLPDPDRCLRAIHRLLADDGITIHVLPGPLWKTTHLLLHLPNRMVLAVERLTEPGALRAMARKLGMAGERAVEAPQRDNNPKIARSDGRFWARLLAPRPHGVSASNLREFAAFRRSRWIRAFRGAGFDLIGILKGPVASGYGFGLERVRRLLERAGFASEFVYIAQKRGHTSRWRSYWEFPPK